MKNASSLSVSAVLGMLGLPGFLGIALLLLAAWFYWGEAPLEAQALQAQTNAVNDMRAQLSQQSSSQDQAEDQADKTQAKSLSVDAAWPAAWQALPAFGHGSETEPQAAILAMAKRQGVLAGSVQFQHDSVAALPGLQRQRLVLPVQATYPALRAWLQAVMQAPGWGHAVSLDALDISRKDVMSDAIEARVSLSLWWRVVP